MVGGLGGKVNEMLSDVGGGRGSSKSFGHSIFFIEEIVFVPCIHIQSQTLIYY